MRGRLYPNGSDWCEWRQDPPLAGTVFVRVDRDAGGRLVLSGLRIEGAPTAELLRAIPVGRIEAAANSQLAVSDRVSDAVALVMRPERASGHVIPTGDDRGWETPDPVYALTRPPTDASANAVSLLVVPGDGARGRPDGFYREVAQTYRMLAESSTRPATELAQANAVPVTTAHRWIKEARRRGFLPPGRPGKAG